jgi:glucan phosphoethanolaminetransferase (alkaline phosphatase superfamily)
MHLNKFKDFVIRYEWLLPTLIFLAVNNIVFYTKKPELDFVYLDYITSIALSALIWGWLYYMGSYFQGCIKFLYKLFLAVFFALIASLSYSVYSEFRQFISFEMLLFLKRNPDYINSFASLYFNEYLLVFLVFLFPLLITLSISLSSTLRTPKSRHIGLILPGIILPMFSYLDLINKKHILTPDVTLFFSFYRLINTSENTQQQIYSFKRDEVRCKNTYKDAPDVFIIVNESLGRKLFGFNCGVISNPCMPLLVNLVNSNPNKWFAFENSLSSSTATDVSIPSIFTGLAPTADRSRFLKNPLLWDYLKSLNSEYYTIFSSPVDFRWANLEMFLNLNDFDNYIHSMYLQGGVINDLGKDEYYSAKAFARAIKEAPKNQPVFGFYFSNSLHSPYQKESVYIKENHPEKSRFCTAQTILDLALNDIISSIFASGRGENSIIFILGDHGDSDKINIKGHRLYSFREEYWSTMLLVYASDKIQSKYLTQFAVLRKNTQSLVGSIDIFPSLVDLFSGSNQLETLSDKFHGFSLFQPIPNDRILIGLNTNDLRSWPQEGFGIAKGKTRMIFNNVHGFSFHDLSTDPQQNQDNINIMDAKTRNFFLDIINCNSELLRVLSHKQQPYKAF